MAVWVRDDALSWQNYLLRAATCALCLTLVFVLIAVIAVFSSPRGSGESPLDGTLNFAIPLCLCGAAGVMLVYLGVLKEREYLLDKLPLCTLPRALTVIVVAGLIAPIMHLTFALTAFLGVLGAAFALLSGEDSSPGRKLWGVAICDALLNLGLAETSRRGGPQGDLAASRLVLFLYGTIGTCVLPAVAIIGTLMYLPRMSNFAIGTYAAFTAHAAVLVLQGLDSLLRDSWIGGGYVFDSPNCIISDIPSPLGMALTALRNIAVLPDYDGPIGPQAPCPSNEALTQQAALKKQPSELTPPLQLIPCQWLSWSSLTFFLSLGASVASLVALWAYRQALPDKRRVAPEPCDEGSTQDVTALATLDDNEPKSPKSWHSHRSRSDSSLTSSRRTSQVSPWKARRRQALIVICILGWAALVIWLAMDGLQCPDEGSEGKSMAASPAPPMYAENTSTTTFLSGGRLLQADTAGNNATNINCPNETNGGNDTSCSNNLTNVTSPISANSNMSTAKKITTTTTTTTTTRTYTKRQCNETGWVDSTGIQPAPPLQCGCSGSSSRGIFGFSSVAAEQTAVVWCDLGMAAPFLFGIAAFLVHSLACALAAEQLGLYKAETRKQSTIRPTIAIVSETEDREARQQKAIIGWSYVEPQEMPQPTHKIGTNRLFSM
eukprot:TRINITY_DN102558_c0_g1_i1.p1 TRINITY_DN102558_c0_g1~~TRINITY_DN102558_c0_g1_i1.p1  ORF type:complete len:662 (+),score=58.30 TRINITY_DN102558_c0_g1_i1:77-2062(+)